MFYNRLLSFQWVLIMNFVAASSGAYAKLPNKALVYCSESSPSGFDASQSWSVPNHTASARTIYNRLLETDGRKIYPSLVTDWDISENGRVYTFHLRRGVKFHATPWFKPTRDFNAEDVLFTFERMRNPDMPFRKAYPAEFPFWHHSNFDKLISKIEALDQGHTVRFTLTLANAPFLFNLAMDSASILSAEYAAQLLKVGHPSEINWKPIGTGPFIFREYVKDATIRFDGNPGYWKPGEVQLSKLIFQMTPDATVRMQKLKANECQVSAALRPVDIAAFEAAPNFKVLSQPGLNLAYLAYNVTHQPLDDGRVRRALDMAIDKKAIIDGVYEGRAQIAVAPIPPLQWGFDESLKDAPRDSKKAKALLAEAGYPNGFSISLFITSVERPYNPNARLMAEMIQSDWAKIGIKANIVINEDFETFLKSGRDGKHDARLSGFSGGNGDPDDWLKLLSCTTVGSGNLSKWCHKEFEDLIQRAAQMTHATERTRLYVQVQKIFKREQPFTPIAYAMDYQVINKHVTGFKINPLGQTVFSGVSLR